MVEKDKVAFSVDAAGKAVARSVSVRKPVLYIKSARWPLDSTPGITMLRPVNSS